MFCVGSCLHSKSMELHTEKKTYIVKFIPRYDPLLDWKVHDIGFFCMWLP